MLGLNQLGAVCGTAILALGLIGCEDPKQRIALLEEENAQLYSDLERLRNEMDTAQRQYANCEDLLSQARQENQSLQQQLASKPETNLPESWESVRGGALLAIDGEVLFKSGKETLRPEAKQVLDRITSQISGNFAGKDIYVFGHTDNDPIKKSGWKDNRELSVQRSLAVVRYLQERGIPAQRIVACGWGEHRPVADNSSPSGKAQNRRVEIFAADHTLAQR